MSGLLFRIATTFSKILLYNLNSFQLSGLLYLGSEIVIIPTIIEKFIEFSKNKDNSKNKKDIKYNNIKNNIKYNSKIFNKMKNKVPNPLKKSHGLKFDKNLLYILLIILFR